MKEKIRLALVAKYKSQGFSNEAIDAMLAYLESTVTAEDQIDAAVDKVAGIFTGFQKEVDRRANQFKSDAEKWQESQKDKGGDPNKGGDPAKPANEPTPPADTPEWAKGFMTQITSLTNEVASLKAGKVGETRQQRLDATLKDAPEAYKTMQLKAFARMKFDKDEDFDSYLEEVKTDSGTFKQSEADTAMGGFKAPAQSKADTGKQASKEEVKSVVDSIM